VQLTLLLVVARLGQLEDVGRLALASAASFTCGAFAELGFGTSLSVPRAYFGTALPPLRRTRRMRVGAALLGSVGYVALWLLGLGGHEPQFLIATPLPALLALSYGYAGAMNASSALAREGRITVVESATTVWIAIGLFFLLDPLPAALGALVAARLLGTALRARAVAAMPQTDEPPTRSPLKTQSWFLLASTLVVLSGQIDLLAAGFVAAFATLGVFGPMIRTAFSMSLVAEALSWSLYGRAGHRSSRETRVASFVQDWSRAAPVLGFAAAVAYFVVAPWFIPFLVEEEITSIHVPIAFFSGAILMRFITFSHSLRLIRAGRQRDRIPGLLLATLVLLVSGVSGALTTSLVVLSAGRFAAETVVAIAYAAATRRAGLPSRLTAPSRKP
jgi:O-antigen/teichoic acid export membrane protein